MDKNYVQSLPSYELAQKTAEAIDVIQKSLALTQPKLAELLISYAMIDVNRMLQNSLIPRDEQDT